MISLDEAADLLHLFERRYRAARLLACDVRQLGALACGARAVWGRCRVGFDTRRGILVLGHGAPWSEIDQSTAAAAVAVARARVGGLTARPVYAMSTHHASDPNRHFLWEWRGDWRACTTDAALAKDLVGY